VLLAWPIIGGSLAFLFLLYILAARNRGWDPLPAEIGGAVSVVSLLAYIWKGNR
jgi:hypothetical protein